MKLPLYNQKAKQVGELELNEFTEGNKANESVISQYVYIYLSNQRQGNANTKDRAEVRGGGKKPWAQKGTGRARVGSNRSPIWSGGGVTFGPTSNRNWIKKTTRNFRTAAFRNVISKLIENELLKVVDNIEVKGGEGLTKQALEMVDAFGAKKITVITAEKNQDLINSFSNLEKARVILVTEVNPYDLISGGTVLVDQKAFDIIKEKWGK